MVDIFRLFMLGKSKVERLNKMYMKQMKGSSTIFVFRKQKGYKSEQGHTSL